MAESFAVKGAVVLVQALPSAIDNWRNRDVVVDECEADLRHCKEIAMKLESLHMQEPDELLNVLKSSRDALARTKERTLVQKAKVVAGMEKADVQKAGVAAIKAKGHAFDHVLVDMAQQIQNIEGKMLQSSVCANACCCFSSAKVPSLSHRLLLPHMSIRVHVNNQMRSKRSLLHWLCSRLRSVCTGQFKFVRVAALSIDWAARVILAHPVSFD